MNPSTTALTLNMQLPNIATVSWAVQGDQLARRITATLVDGSTPWTPEASYHGVVRFHKPDGTSGVYDVDEEGNTAVTWSGNVATVTIAQQALTFPGTVLMQLEFYDTNDARLTAFGWVNNVQPSAVTDTEFLSTDYYNILTLQISAVLEVAGEMTPYSETPEMDGVGSPGTSVFYSRGDHVHPTDTSRASAEAVLQATVQTISGNGTTSGITLTGLTANHVVANWGMFSDSACTTPIPENTPTCDITITTAANSWSVTIANFTSTFYLRPTFILKQN